MAINTGDTRIAIIEEVTHGVTPATPAFKVLDYLPGSGVREQADTGQLNTRRANRSSAGQYVSGRSATGRLDFEFKRDGAIEALIEGATGGTWTSNVCKGGTGLKSYTVEETMYNDGTALYRQSTGCMVNFSLEADFNGPAKAMFEVVGLASDPSGAAITGATYTAASTKPVIKGEDVTSVVIGSLSGITPTHLSLKVAHERQPKSGFGSTTASFIGTGRRTIEGSMKFLVADLAGLDLTGQSIAISFTMSSGVNGYSFSIPAAVVGVPQDSEDGTALEIEVPFVADYNSGISSDISVTRLT
jgi:Phage tail tube protein